MKCVVALALALTAQAVDINWKIPVAQPSVTVDKATDATITFKWNGFHSVFEVPSKAAMDSCDFTDAQEIAPQSNGGSVTVDAPAAGETKYYACDVGSHCLLGQRVAITSEGASDEPTQNIVEIAQSMTETFSTLLGLLQAADLVDTLSGPGPFTVFAPTNDAFAKIDAATLESLTKPEGKDLLTSTPVWRSN